MTSGDIRVLLVLDIILSAIYATIVVWGLELVDMAAFTLENVAIGTVIIATLTYILILRQ
ncbi:hypothetical protein [Halanaeroarchaeum sulfurireducens]|uniref:DUF8107 domain-containing protein n=1 Tax=Halanaeroarchaeum sulfurireducens TaxID=1604004 RepID=A0A0F7PBX4_9EURY|nr:hypothetical protein [Halanaeroarchaeum sulfurireducens]AKH96863.1 hypothetical protein HLASF_0357 [Halanaeroarchaeum sulfurireducens]ALG81265.1 hypothetical protein HLASA_0356 [Halanaeroarchaeum sulfurireducens]